MASDNVSSSIGKRIVRGGIAVVIAHALFKLVSVAQVIILGRYIDNPTFDVVYVFAFDACIFSIFLIGEGLIRPTFLPVFMGEMDAKGENTAWQFSNAVITIQFLILLIIVALIVFFPDNVIRLFTAWNTADNPEEFSLGRKCLILLAPALIFFSLGTTTYMLLNGYKRFFFAAFGDTSWKLCVLIFVLVGMGLFGVGYQAVVFGILVGSIAKLCTHLLGLMREVKYFRVNFKINTPQVKSMLLLMAPLICGIVFARIRDIFNNVTILSYLDTHGLMKANFLGRKLFTTIGWLVPYAFSIAMFPFFCELVDKNDKKKFGEILTQSGRMLLSVFIPLCLVCVVMAKPMSFLLFYGEKCTRETVHWISVSTACYILVLPAYALEYLLMQAFFANRRMVSVTVAGIIFSALSIAISYIGIAIYGVSGVTALAVVALGFTFSRTLKVSTLILLLKKSVPLFPFYETASFLTRALMVGVISAGFCLFCILGFNTYISARQEEFMLLFKLSAAGLCALAGFVLSAKVFRLKEPEEMLRWALRRFRKPFLSEGEHGIQD